MTSVLSAFLAPANLAAAANVFPEGGPLHRPASGPARQCYAQAFSCNHSMTDSRWTRSEKSRSDFGLTIGDPDQEDLVTTVLFEEAGLWFGIRAFDQITGGPHAATREIVPLPNIETALHFMTLPLKGKL